MPCLYLSPFKCCLVVCLLACLLIEKLTAHISTKCIFHMRTIECLSNLDSSETGRICHVLLSATIEGVYSSFSVHHGWHRSTDHPVIKQMVCVCCLSYTFFFHQKTNTLTCRGTSPSKASLKELPLIGCAGTGVTFATATRAIAGSRLYSGISAL